MKTIDDLRIKIFADGANKQKIVEMYKQPYIKGFTTNPTLMRKVGVRDYEAFAKDIIQAVPDKPISFEVFSDDFGEMKKQALEIAKWGKNIYVKIPITNTKGESSFDLIKSLADAGVKINVTAMMPLSQVKDAAKVLAGGPPAYLSVFAGRVADTGVDPVPIMAEAVEICSSYANIELIWASPREVLNIFQADSIGCHIITVTDDILKKLHLIGKDLSEFSLETVKMFYNDACEAGFKL